MSSNRTEALVDKVEGALGDHILEMTVDREEVSVTVKPDDILTCSRVLFDDPGLSFNQLSDLSGVDYLTFGDADWITNSATNSGFSRGVAKGQVDAPMPGPRFAVVYQLMSVEHNQRLRLKTFPEGEPPRLSSVISVWAGADWYEREAFDLFGILFDGHPDLRRILTDYGFIGHPFRKDFPLEGHVEVRYDEEQKRVVYQPVTIENRVLVPRVIREDLHYGGNAASEATDRNDA